MQIESLSLSDTLTLTEEQPHICSDVENGKKPCYWHGKPLRTDELNTDMAKAWRQWPRALRQKQRPNGKFRAHFKKK